MTAVAVTTATGSIVFSGAISLSLKLAPAPRARARSLSLHVISSVQRAYQAIFSYIVEPKGWNVLLLRFVDAAAAAAVAELLLPLLFCFSF